MHPAEGILRAVRVVPTNPDSAPLTFVFTSFPGVILHAGLLHDFPTPQCGCDACDETAGTAADELESIVLAVVAGGYRERYDEDADLGIGYSLSHGELRRSGRRAVSSLDSIDRMRAAAARLQQLPDGWQPWKRRS
jgi:hypothetical protein